MTKKIPIIIAAIMLLGSTAYAKDDMQTLVKEYEFVTESDEFDYDAPNEIVEDDVKYSLKEIEYQILSEEPIYDTQTSTFTEEVFYETVDTEDETLYEEYITIDEDGYTGTIPLTDVIYTERIVTGRTASHKVEYDFGLQVEEPDPADEIDTLYHDDESDVDVLVTLQLQKLKVSTKAHWEENITVEYMHRSIYEDKYQLNDGTYLSFDESEPVYQDIEEDILNQLGLSTDTHKITGSVWISDKETEDGVTSRLAGYTVKRYVTGYTAIYSGTFDIPDMLVYDATAVYEGTLAKQIVTGTEYKVKAIVTYEEITEENNTAAVVIGTSSGIIVLCGLVVLLNKRKKKKGEMK